MRVRTTRQQTILGETVAAMRGTYTARDVLERARRADARIGIATVYRYLGDASAKDHLHAFLCGRKTVYTRTDDTHCHFTCTRCGTVRHFAITEADFLKDVPGTVCHLQLDVHGICETCAKKNA
jgi:Fe2+ or Zn2+ uptake regulation protein